MRGSSSASISERSARIVAGTAHHHLDIACAREVQTHSMGETRKALADTEQTHSQRPGMAVARYPRPCAGCTRSPGHGTRAILLNIEDITDWCASERALRGLVQERHALQQEISNRVATSPQIAASDLSAGARTAGSEETRQHLEDAHNRVMALSALQRTLRAPQSGAKVMVGPYLTRLCETLAPEESGGRCPVSVQVEPGPGSVASGQAVSISLAMTELVVNALEHAFPCAAHSRCRADPPGRCCRSAGTD